MIDLDAMKNSDREQPRTQVKTFLTAAARERVKAAAAYTGRTEYAIIEAAIMSAVPAVSA